MLVNLMLDKEFRKDALRMLKDIARPVVYEIITPDILKATLHELMDKRLKDPQVYTGRTFLDQLIEMMRVEMRGAARDVFNGLNPVKMFTEYMESYMARNVGDITRETAKQEARKAVDEYITKMMMAAKKEETPA